MLLTLRRQLAYHKSEQVGEEDDSDAPLPLREVQYRDQVRNLAQNNLSWVCHSSYLDMPIQHS
jgi:hypothetical protein